MSNIDRIKAMLKGSTTMLGEALHRPHTHNHGHHHEHKADGSCCGGHHHTHGDVSEEKATDEK